ncbi:uncharacterized protein M421DRAFT_302 [Didymella exigua CBS 183.55]|uniref:Uncharacterized protein n=1 Tax=Didymella exigua CBS 183.55 TaxID=1150837 RepID=A0A6A5S322_9PLEO|nr:uncharacterized protein M421DRAFT_302 [Didymella exigua CBS 183.55]KAF1934149.1 hypothetical protein M421DRAFT_302 [Didymella exigua CBS 183.55]
MSNPNDLTSREMEVLALAWQCMDTEPKINTKKLAELTGYTEGSASVTMGKIKRKLKLKAAGSSSVVNTPKKAATPHVPRTPKSAKRGAAEAVAGGTPSKKGRTSKPANDDDDDEEFGKFSIKKEEVNDINAGADTFQETSHYAAMGGDQD